MQSGADGEIVLQSGAGSRAVLLQNANGELVNFVVADEKVQFRLGFYIFTIRIAFRNVIIAYQVITLKSPISIRHCNFAILN